MERFFRVENYCYIYTMEKSTFSLDCGYYTKSFATLNELLDDIVMSGQDPNHEILRNGRPTGETAWDLIGPGA